MNDFQNDHEVKVLIYIDYKVFTNNDFNDVMNEIHRELSNLGIQILDYRANPIVASIISEKQLENIVSLQYVSM